MRNLNAGEHRGVKPRKFPTSWFPPRRRNHQPARVSRSSKSRRGRGIGDHESGFNGVWGKRNPARGIGLSVARVVAPLKRRRVDSHSSAPPPEGGGYRCFAAARRRMGRSDGGKPNGSSPWPRTMRTIGTMGIRASAFSSQGRPAAKARWVNELRHGLARALVAPLIACSGITSPERAENSTIRRAPKTEALIPIGHRPSSDSTRRTGGRTERTCCWSSWRVAVARW